MLINNAVITGSLTVNGTDVTYITGSSQISSSFLALSSSYLITSASYVVTSGSYAITSASFAQTSGSLSIRTGNLEATSSTLTSASSSFAAQSASLSTRLTTDETNITTLTNASASFAVVSSSFSSTSGSLSTRVTNLEATSSTVSSSFASTSGSIAGRVTLIEGQYATTGSNTFTNIQYISSSTNAAGFTTSASLYTDGGARITKDLFVSGTTYLTNLTVYGTASVQYITSSQINVGANIIYLNTQTPAVRYGGMAVADSGSNAGVTGSMLWDSVNNGWIYTRESGSTYSGGALISGPRSSVQGSEQGTLNNYITKGQGGDHITSSQIIDDGTTVQIPGNLQVTGSIVGSSTATFSSRLNVNGTTDDADIALHTKAPAGAGKYIYVGRDSSDQWKFSVRSDGFTNVGSGTTAEAKLLTVQSAGNNLDTGAVIRIIGNAANDLVDISVSDTKTRIYHQENAADAANGYGIVQFRTNAVGNATYPTRGGFQFTIEAADVLFINSIGQSTFANSVTVNGGYIRNANTATSGGLFMGNGSVYMAYDGTTINLTGANVNISSNLILGSYVNSNITLNTDYKIIVRQASMTLDAVTPSWFGYSTGYGMVKLGSTDANRSLAFNVDVTGNPSGAFSGNGSEYVWRNAGSFITPNSINNGYNTLFGWNSSGQISFNQAATFNNNLTAIGGNVIIGDYTQASNALTFAASANGIAKINFYDSNNTEGLYMRTDGEPYGGTMTFGARWDDDEAKIVFKMYQVSAGGTYNARVGIGTGAINPLSMLHVCELDGGNYLGSLRIGGSSGFGIVSEYTQSAFTTGTMYVSPGYTSNDTLFKLGAASGNTNQLVLRGNGCVGVNVVSPTYRLEVNGTNGSIAISGSGYVTNPVPMLLGLYTSTRGYIQVPNQGSFEVWNGGTSAIVEFKNNSDSVFNGNVGIGISPIGKLTVKQPYTSATTPIYFGNTSFTAWNRQSYDTMILQQDDVTSFRMVEKNGEANTSDQVLCFSIGDGSATIATSAQPLKFFVNGSPTGVTYQGLSGTLALTLQTNGSALFGSDIVASGDITAYSDISVKENIRPIENALQRVTKSRGVLYDRIDSDTKNNIGFIAQELELEFPELISVNADGTKGVKYQNAVAILFEAIKEQQTQIEELKTLVYALTK